MASRSSKPAYCQHQQKSSSCSSCRQELAALAQLGTWAPGSNPPRADINTFVKDSKRYPFMITMPQRYSKTDSEALRPGTKSSNQHQSQPQAQSKKPTQQPTSTTNSKNQRPNNNTSYPLTLRQQSRFTTPTSSVVATRGNSPATHRTPAPVYHPRQVHPATSNAAVLAHESRCLLTPQTASLLGARLARTHITAVYKPERSDSSRSSSSDSSDDDDDE